MFKNVASQKVAVFAWDNAAGAAKTGDAANISAQISKDGAATAATNDVAPTELDATDAPGIYIFDMTQAETNADLVVIAPVSSTSDIVLRPVIIYTQTVMRGTDSANTTIPDVAGTAATPADVATALTNYAGPTKAEMDTAHGLLATETKQDIIDANVDQIEAAVITNAAGTDIAADIIALKAVADALNDITVANVLDGVIEGAYTLQDSLKIMLAYFGGKTSGGGTATVTFRDTGDSKDRVVLTVDADGDRSAAVLDVS